MEVERQSAADQPSDPANSRMSPDQRSNADQQNDGAGNEPNSRMDRNGRYNLSGACLSSIHK